MEQGKKNMSSFHLAGIIPVAGQPLDFEMPWHDCMQPLAPGYLAIHQAVMQCATAGCETIWIICHRDMQPLIRHEVGEHVQDPVWFGRPSPFASEERKTIPIYYIPIHPKDRDRRDCLGWSVLYGANCAYWVSRKMSKWVIPDMYYTAFPYGVFSLKELRQHRKQISSHEKFFLTYQGESVQQGQYLGFTFDAEDFKKIRAQLRKDGTGMWSGDELKDGKYPTKKLPVEERYSARYFSLDKVFKNVILEGANKAELSWFYDIGSWEGYCKFIGSSDRENIKKPYNKILSYREFNEVGYDIED